MTAAQRTKKRKARQTARRERAAERALARSAVYRLLSQTLVYPDAEAVSTLQGDLPQALAFAASFPDNMAPLLDGLAQQLDGKDARALQSEHLHVFSHVQSADCPPGETAYTTQNVFQETQELSDLNGFFRAFGLELAERERPDHISVELEFMYVLTYKEAYALLHHDMEKARLCRIVQRKFMGDHLGRWALQFAELLGSRAEGGYLLSVAGLTKTFLTQELALLRARPDAVTGWRLQEEPGPDEFACPLAQDCLEAEPGGQDAPV
jgi:TorA maturation chaperone TorD